MSKHTPGPWVANGPDWAGDYNITPPHEAAVVAAVINNVRPATEVEANARLIAAAPDLLDALKAVIDTSQASPSQWVRACSLAAAAIAKAEGRT